MAEQKVAPKLAKFFPALRYQDAPAAIEWLVKAFGMEKQMVIPGPDGTIAHSQLKLGEGVIMVGSSRDDSLKLKSPIELGGASTQSIYIYVPDLDVHYDRAKSAGAEIVTELRDTEYGSREFSARDPEGHLWHFGTYLPEE
jgi:uncharacterized glyoxalase superfamily protein PhnB